MRRSLVFWLLPAVALQAQAGGGPLGIDHRLAYDNSGIWKRSNQTFVEYGTLAVVIGGALWEGGETRLGRTYWKTLDAVAIEAVSSTLLKEVFTRPRPGGNTERIIRPCMRWRPCRRMTRSRG